jgi:hypothetical protein
MRLAGQRPGVLAALLAHLAEARVHGRHRRPSWPVQSQHAARPVALRCSRASLGQSPQLGLFLGVQVVQVAEELVEAVHRGQVVVAVTEVVLAELRGAVAQRLEDLGQRRVTRVQTDRRAGQAHGGQAGADRQLPGDEGGAPSGAARVRVVVGEQHAFAGDAVDVGRGHHHPVAVGADVGHAHIVGHDDQDVGPLGLRRRRATR